MGLTVVYCPDCDEGFYDRNGTAASLRWAEHFATAHSSEGPES